MFSNMFFCGNTLSASEDLENIVPTSIVLPGTPAEDYGHFFTKFNSKLCSFFVCFS